MHTNLIAALAEDRRKSCLCGAVTGQSHHPCRTCLARLVWRRFTNRPPRSTIRRLVDRQARAWARAFAAAASMLRILSKGARS